MLEWENATPLVVQQARNRDKGRSAGHRKGDGELRPFIVWDGEGAEMSADGTKPQAYCILGNSEGGLIRCKDFKYLTTAECLTFLIAEKVKYPNHIHVGFAIGYDMEMILRNVPFELLMRRARNGSFVYKRWRITTRSRKYFQVTDIQANVSITIYDIWPFWQCSAIKAFNSDPRIGPDDERVKFITSGKSARGTFLFREIDSKVLPYMRVELALYRSLIEHLRDSLRELDLIPAAWYGPSAVVSKVYRRSGLQQYMNRPRSDKTRKRRRGVEPSDRYEYTLPDQVNLAALAAFFGGRFEPFKIGVRDGPTFEYDINSAYPYAMTFLPQLSKGRWAHYDKDELDKLRKTQLEPPNTCRFGFYRIWYNFAEDADATVLAKAIGTMPPHPMAHRETDGRVSFPRECFGWSAYWTAEAIWKTIPSAQFIEAHVWEPDDDFKPFANALCVDVPTMYEQRNQFGRIGRSDLKYVLKITLNSGYGKLAQQVGTGMGDNLPSYHQMEWAAHITDYCRARMWMYARDAWATGSLISIETDAIFTTRPLPRAEKHRDEDALGGLKRVDFQAMAIIQSGVYFTCELDKWTFHCRGLDRDCWTIDDVRQYFSSVDWEATDWPTIMGRTTLFHTANLCGVRFGHPDDFYSRWLRWAEHPKDVAVTAHRFKRYHNPHYCKACKQGIGPHDMMHDLCSKNPDTTMSSMRKHKWLDETTEDEDYVKAMWGRIEVRRV